MEFMTTTAVLESLNDRSLFERLATNVLRMAEAKYSAIIQTGVNAQGETIAAPVDGLLLIPYSNPPHYVFVQHTTTDRNRLRRKWLSDKDADLVKAAREAKKIRQKQPHAIFTVVLTCNQRVDIELAIDVYQRAETEGMTADIWEQTRLAAFLDSTSDGHWLRKFYLRIEAEQLSVPLLHQLGRQSLERYKQNILLPDHDTLVQRGLSENIINSVLIGGVGLCLVAGASGYGKSVATLQALERCLSSGSLGLWIPVDIFQAEASIESVLEVWLRSLLPSLQVGAGRAAIGLAERAGQILLFVDDVNQTPEAARLLRYAVSLAAPSSHNLGRALGTGSSPPPSPFLRFVIPVWPENLSLLPSRTLEKPWVRTVSVGELLPNECSELIRSKVPRLSELEARDCAKRLNHDPFLVGLFMLLANERMDAQELGTVTDDAIGESLDHWIRKLCSVASVNLLQQEFLDALVRVAREMILRRILRPSLQEMEGWFGDQSKEMRALRQLIKQFAICRLDHENRLCFRHDRLRERFMVQAMSDLLRLPEPPDDIVNDPYYSSIIGKALIKYDFPAERIAQIRCSSPWTIFEAIRQFAGRWGSHQQHLLQEARIWAAEESKSATESVCWAISWSLTETDSREVLSIIDLMKPNPLLMVAGLRNGSAQHGMRFLRPRTDGDFEPGSSDELRDRVIDYANHRHGELIAEQVHERLLEPDISATDARAYLALLGHFRFRGFDQAIHEVWNRHQDEVLAYVIWAAARCPLLDVGILLGPLLGRIANLPLSDDEAGVPPGRRWMTLYLGWGFRQGITSESLAFLLAAARSDASLNSDIALMVEGVDDPDALEFLVRYLSSGGDSPLWSRLTGIGDSEPTILLRSHQTNERLCRIWQSTMEQNMARSEAFCIWLQTSGCRDAALLNTIGPGSSFYHYAVQHRIKLGDRSVTPELLDLLQSDDLQGWWWILTHRVWSNEFR